jgi:hypothetical protein
MAKHKFDGHWKYYDVDDRRFPPTTPPQPDGEMWLVIEDDGQGNGTIGRGSKHNKVDDLTGDVTTNKIRMREQDPQNLIDSSYEGYLVESGQSMILVGTWKNNLALKTKRIFADGQNDGTWVMTKP